MNSHVTTQVFSSIGYPIFLGMGLRLRIVDAQ